MPSLIKRNIMGRIIRFEDLYIWQESLEVFKEIQCLARELDGLKEFALSKQMKSSSGSIMDNIAEGFDRNGNREFIQFLSISRASCAELKSQIFRAKIILNFCENTKSNLFEKLGKISSGCYHLMQHLKSLDHKGLKFK